MSVSKIESAFASLQDSKNEDPVSAMKRVALNRLLDPPLVDLCLVGERIGRQFKVEPSGSV